MRPCLRENGWLAGPPGRRPDEVLSGITIERALAVVQDALSRFPSSGLRYRRDPVNLKVHEALVAAMGRG